MLLRLLIICSFSFSLSSCDYERVWVEHEVADCCNPWGESVAPDDLEERVVDFLETNGIPVFETRQVDTGRKVICAICCDCPTGNFVGAYISADNVARAEGLEFLEEQ